MAGVKGVMKGGIYLAKACEVILYPEDGWNEETIRTVIDSKRSIKKFAFICHDKDTENGQLMKAHFHVYLSFGEASVTFKHVSGWFQIKEGQVERIKGTRKSMLQYLMHLNAPGKYQYPMEDIVSNFDVAEYLEKEAAQETLNSLIEKCASGEITPYNYPEYIPPTMFARHKTKFENAWKYFEDQYSNENNAVRSITVIWIYGESGSGKSTLAKLYAIRSRQAIYFTSQGAHPFDHYAAQPICVIDELRPNVPLTFVDLLQILDPYTVREVSARYRDKLPLFHTVFITSLLSPERFFLGAAENEDPYQLYRRVSAVWHVTKERIEVLEYDGKRKQFIETDSMINPVPAYLRSLRKPANDTSEILGQIIDQFASEPKAAFEELSGDVEDENPFTLVNEG